MRYIIIIRSRIYINLFFFRIRRRYRTLVAVSSSGGGTIRGKFLSLAPPLCSRGGGNSTFGRLAKKYYFGRFPLFSFTAIFCLRTVYYIIFICIVRHFTNDRGKYCIFIYLCPVKIKYSLYLFSKTAATGGVKYVAGKHLPIYDL